MKTSLLHPELTSAADVNAFAGDCIPTSYLTGAADPRGIIEFSAKERYVAHITQDSGAVDVWDVVAHRHECRFEHLSVHGAKFSADDRYLVTYSETGGTVWDLASRVIRCHLDWSAYHLSALLFTTFETAGTFIVASEGHVLQFDPDSGRLLQARTLADSPTDTMLWGLDSQGTTIVEVVTQGGSSAARRQLCYTSMLRLSEDVSLTVGQNKSVLATESHIAVIRDNANSMAEVWDVRAQRLLCTFPHLSVIGNLQFGPNTDWLAYAYDPPTRSRGCELQIWDLKSGSCLHHYEGTLSWDILWSQRSGMLAMFNLFPYEQKPRRNLTLFFDPIKGGVLAHTYGQSGTSRYTYRSSPTGRFLASVFDQGYTANDGELITAGTIAICDLTPVHLGENQPRES